MIILPSYSPARIEGDYCYIDRKFHTGLCLFTAKLKRDWLALVPSLKRDEQKMDFIRLPMSEVPYRIKTVDCDNQFNLTSVENHQVEALVAGSDLVYGLGFNTDKFARRHGIPYIPIVEYDFETNLDIALLRVNNPLRRLSRYLKTCIGYLRETIAMRGGVSVHCNGFPIYRQSRRFNKNCLLYLDSRMYSEMVISPSVLEARLRSLEQGRQPRLLYSGRFEPMKGALDVVRVGVELARMNVGFELHIFGQGPDKGLMVDEVKRRAAAKQIFIHDAIPYPDLVEFSRTADLFICCHVQSDPSCTYIEAFGSGLPIVGYKNRMFGGLLERCEAGVATPIGDAIKCAEVVAGLLSDVDRFRTYSTRARDFSINHCFELEFQKRIDSVNDAILGR